MPDHSKSRMYTRSSQGAGSRFSSSTPSPETSNGATALDSLDNHRRPGHIDARATFDKFQTQMGVSPLVLRTLFRHNDIEWLQNLESHIAQVQLARVGLAGSRNRTDAKTHLDFSNLEGLDRYALELALTVKPVDTLYELLDQNQNDADIRELRAYIAEDRLAISGELPKDPAVRELLDLYQRVMDAEVRLLLGSGTGSPRAQAKEIAEHAAAFLDAVRELVRQPRAGASESTYHENGTASTTDAAKPGAKPQRITAETMKAYREKGGWA